MITFEAKKNKQKIEFHFQRNSANGLSHLIVWEKGARNILWDVNLNYFPGGIINYGEVPNEFTTFNGVRNIASQNYPDNETIAPLERDSEIYVYISCVHDTFFVPSSSVKVFSFRINSDGTIHNIGEVKMPPFGKAPAIFD